MDTGAPFLMRIVNESQHEYVITDPVKYGMKLSNYSQTSTAVCRWSLGMDKYFDLTLYDRCNYLTKVLIKGDPAK